MKPALLLVALCLAHVAPAQGERSIAEALRGPARRYGVRDIPEAYRAVALGDGSGGLASLALFGLGGAPERPREALFFAMFGATFVDPDAFDALLAGRVPRIRGLAVDFAGTLAATPSSGDLPDPVLSETWIEAGRVVAWRPRPDLSRERLLSVFGKASIDTGNLEDAKRRTLANAKNIILGITLYGGNEQDRFPKANSTAQAQAAIVSYLTSAEVWTTDNPNGGHLLYNTRLSGMSVTALASLSETLVLWDERAWPDGSRVVSFADGSTRSLTAEEWRRAWARELARRKAARAS